MMTSLWTRYLTTGWSCLGTTVGLIAAAMLSTGSVPVTDTASPPEKYRFAATLDGDGPTQADELASEYASAGLQVRAVYPHLATVVALADADALETLRGDARLAAFDTFSDRHELAPTFDVFHDAAESLPTDRPVLYVLDSPVATDHDWFMAEQADLLVATGYASYVQRRDSCQEHGTNVAGVAVGDTGVAWGVTVVPLAVSCGGRIDPESLLGAYEWVAANHPAGVPGVVNASLSTDSMAVLEHAVRQLHSHGLAQVWAAGNGGIDACSQLRERIQDVALIVGSVDRGYEVPGTNDGPCVDVFAAGVHVRTASADGGTTRFEGTSSAAPRVSGILLRLLQDDPTMTPDNLYDQLLAGSHTGRVRGARDGSPDRFVRAETSVWHYDRQYAHTDDDPADVLTNWDTRTTTPASNGTAPNVR